MSSRSVPYAQATSGERARAEVAALLRRFGCESVGFMDDFADQSLMLAFQWHGRRVQLRASARGWAAMYLRENPWHRRRRSGKEEWERRAVEQGMVAVNSVLRDWIKGQVTAVESGLLAFDHVFLPYMLTDNGQTVAERIGKDTLLIEDATGAEGQSR